MFSKSKVWQSMERHLDQPKKVREAIFYADLNGNHQREENEPILVVPAENYEKLFHIKSPLTRMLRRQINHMEYIALNQAELDQLLTHNSQILNDEHKANLDTVYLVIPEVKMERGYYITQMKIITLGQVKEVTLNTSGSQQTDAIPNYRIYFETKPAINLYSTDHFIRWLGL